MGAANRKPATVSRRADGDVQPEGGRAVLLGQRLALHERDAESTSETTIASAENTAAIATNPTSAGVSRWAMKIVVTRAIP